MVARTARTAVDGGQPVRAVAPGRQVDRLEPRALGEAGDAAALGDRRAVDHLDVAGEVDRRGAADVRADRVGVDRRAAVLEVRDPLGVQAARHDDPARGGSRPGRAAPAPRGPGPPVTRPRSDGVSSRTPYSRSPSAWATRSASSASSLNVSTRTMRGTSDRCADRRRARPRRCRRRSGRASAASSRSGSGRPGAPPRRRRAHASTDNRCVVEDVGDVRMDVPRTEADHRLGLAASTHSLAAVAQPVDWASIPRKAVSYSPNRR